MTPTSISLSWSVPSDPVADSYEVMWQRDTSGEFSDEDEGSYCTTITDGSTDYTITGLEEDNTYRVTVTAVYSIGNKCTEAELRLHCMYYNFPYRGNVKSNITVHVAQTLEAGISNHCKRELNYTHLLCSLFD